MRKIWKYTLDIVDDVQEFRMPISAIIRSVAMQSSHPCMWVEVDSEQESENRSFKIFGTGHIITDYLLEYVGSCFDNKLNLVWHIYEVP